jgi:hypothetical protein
MCSSKYNILVHERVLAATAVHINIGLNDILLINLRLFLHSKNKLVSLTKNDLGKCYKSKKKIIQNLY